MTPDDMIQIELIKRLKYRYMRCLDQKLWGEMREVFTADATAAYSGGEYSFDGVEAIIAFLDEAMGRDDFLSSHRVHHPEIDLIDGDHAVGMWALEDFVIIGEHDICLQGAAFYEDRYERVAGSWKISHTGYRRTYEQMWPRSSVAGLALTANWFTE